jgi:hypothetical protein
MKTTSDLTRRIGKLIAESAVGNCNASVDGGPRRQRFKTGLKSDVIQ